MGPMMNRKRNLASKLFGLILACGLNAAAVTSITSGPIVVGIHPTRARFVWTTDISTSSRYVKLGTFSPPSTSYTGQTSSDRLHSISVSGLAAGTTYYYQVCNNDGGEVCSTTATFNTQSLPAQWPETAVLPDESWDTSVPTQTGTTWYVGSDCNDPTTGFLARWNSASWGDTIVIPAGTKCIGTYKLNGKAPDTQTPHRWIVIRSDGKLPPEGTRVDPSYQPQMATFISNHPKVTDATLGSSSPTPANCIVGAFIWNLGDTDALGFKLWRCTVASSGISVSSVTGDGVSPIVVTSSGHGLTNGTYIYISGVGGNTAANGSYKVASATTDTFALEYIYDSWDSTVGNGNYTGGGTIKRFQWEKVSYSSGTNLPPTCTAGSWFVLTSGYGTIRKDRSYWCTETNTWTQINLEYSLSAGNQTAAIDASCWWNDCGSYPVKYVRFVGIEFTLPTLPYDSPLDLRGTPERYLYYWNNLVSFDSENDHVILDRCYVHGNSNGNARGMALGAVTAAGGYFAVLDSYFDDLAVWETAERNSVVSYSSAIYGSSVGTGPIKIQNNFFDAPGVSVFYRDDHSLVLADAHVPHDIVVRGNHFRWNRKWRYDESDSGSALEHVVVRHLLEFKLGKRILVEGNIFENTWTKINNAAAVLLSPRLTGSVYQNGSLNNDTFTCTYGAPTWKPCAEVSVGEWVYIAASGHNKLYQVAAKGVNSFTLSGMSGATGSASFMRLETGVTLSDVTLRYNVFGCDYAGWGCDPDSKGVANGIWITGSTKYNPMQNLAQRFTIHDNIFARRCNEGNGWACADHYWSTYQYGWGGGSMLRIDYGVESVIFRHNTIADDGSGLGGTVLGLYNDLSRREGGLKYTDNIVFWGPGGASGHAVSVGSSYYGTAALNWDIVQGSAPDWQYDHNVWSIGFAVPSSAPYGPYPSGKWTWRTDQSGAFPFTDATGYNFTVTSTYRSTDTCVSVPGDCTTDGKDIGSDYQAVLLALGFGGAGTETKFEGYLKVEGYLEVQP